MRPSGKKWLALGALLTGAGFIGATAGILAISSIEGDEAVLSDIERHFAAVRAPEQLWTAAPEAERFTSDIEIASSPAQAQEAEKERSRRRETQRRPHRRPTKKPNRAQTEPETGFPGIRRIGPATFEIGAGLADRARRAPEAFITGVNARLAVIKGEPAGFRLSGVRRGGALHALGLRTGDILAAVNGHALGTIDQALLAAGAARVADRFRVDIIRAGQRHALYYRVAEFE